jgi:Protein of unknown function (DUF1761)
VIFDFFDDLNWLAVVVAAIAWFAFSAVWYSVPPLSKTWQANAKVNPEEGGSFAAILVPTFIGYLVTTVVIALLAKAIGAADFGDGFALGASLGIGFGVVGALVSQLYEQKGRSYWLINGVNAIIAYVIVAVIVTVWD